MRSDEHLKANAADMYLLAAVALETIVREPLSSMNYELDGRPVRLELSWLAREDLIDLRLSGLPKMAPRGERLLRELVEARRDEKTPPER